MKKTHLDFTPVQYSGQLSQDEFDSIPKNTHYIFNIESENSIFPIPGLIYLEAESEFLTVLFNGAVDRDKSDHLTFQRWSWIKKIRTNVLILPDPTLTRGNFALGWGAGLPSEWPILRMSETINNFVNKIGISNENVALYGSSAGGFQAFLCGMMLENVKVIMENPQTNVFRYYERHVDALTNECFPDISQDGILEKFGERFCLIQAIKKYGRSPFFIYVQNKNDVFHQNRHYTPFKKGLIELGIEENSFQVNIIDGEKTHSPGGIDQLVGILKEVFRENYQI